MQRLPFSDGYTAFAKRQRLAALKARRPGAGRRPYAPAVRIESIGWQTDLRLRELEGAEILARADHLLVRTPENPGFRWGNFLVLGRMPAAGEAERWLNRFSEAFPTAGYVALGVDGTPTDPARR